MMDKRIRICIVTQFTDNFYFGTLIKNIHRYVNKIGGSVFILNTFMLYYGSQNKSFIPSYFSLSKSHLDGYIILPQGASDEHIHLISQFGKPVMLVNKMLDSDCHMIVKDDGFEGMFTVVEHLLKQGHRKIAFIGWFGTFDMVERFEGYKNALESNGIPFRHDYVYETENAIEIDGKKAAKMFLERTPEVTAIVGANDLLAYGAMEVFQSAGLRVPEDIAICGYDNSNITRECQPQMTSVEQNIPLLGQTAAKVLCNKILGNEITDSVVDISPKLVVRKSSVLDGKTDNTSSFTSLNKAASIQLFRYLEKILFNSRRITASLKNANFQSISQILPQIPAEFKRAGYGEWICENNLPKCLSMKKIYNFSPDENIIGNEYILQDFPPKQLMFELSDMDKNEAVFIVPVRSGSYEMGVFSYIAPINQYSEFINVNFTALNYEFFSFVMDRELYAEEIKKKNSEKINAINTMVAGIAHQLNTPIGIGISASTLITEKADRLLEAFESGSLKRQDFLSIIKDIKKSGSVLYESINRSSEMVNKFKTLLFDESNDLKKFNVKQNTQHILTILSFKLNNIKQNIKIICDENLEVISYPAVIAQILTNLITNSIVHGFEKDSEGNITIRYQKLNDYLVLIFEDNGKGMEKDVVNRIFDAFYTTKHAAGTGLGLNIVYNLVKEHLKGTIICESEIGKGTKFTIQFPIQQ